MYIKQGIFHFVSKTTNKNTFSKHEKYIDDSHAVPLLCICFSQWLDPACVQMNSPGNAKTDNMNNVAFIVVRLFSVITTTETNTDTERDLQKSS